MDAIYSSAIQSGSPLIRYWIRKVNPEKSYDNTEDISQYCSGRIPQDRIMMTTIYKSQKKPKPSEICVFATEHTNFEDLSYWMEIQLISHDFKADVNRNDSSGTMLLYDTLMLQTYFKVVRRLIKKGVQLDVHRFTIARGIPRYEKYQLPKYRQLIYEGPPLHQALKSPLCPIDVIESLITEKNINSVMQNVPEPILRLNDLLGLGRLNTAIEIAVCCYDRYARSNRSKESRKELVSLLLQYGAEVPGLHTVFDGNSYNLRTDALQFLSALTIRRAIKVKKSIKVYKGLSSRLPEMLIEYCSLKSFTEEVFEKLKDTPCPPLVVFLRPFCSVDN